MIDNEARVRELAQWLFNEPPTESEIKFLASALDAAELRGKREGLKEAQALSPIDDASSMFTVHEERKRLHNAIAGRLAALGAEPEDRR